jgi:hypothetical protein
MNEQQLFRSHVDALRGQLGRLEAVVGERGIDTSLLDRVWVRLTKLLNEQRTNLDGLDQQVREGETMAATWGNLRAIQEASVPLFAESLAFLEGVVARRAGVDGGLCELADALLIDLSRKADVPWERFTILSEGEYWADMADVIRLRFPEVSIWSLPVAIHEFGHFLGPRLERKGPGGTSIHPFQVMLEAEWQRGIDEGPNPGEAMRMAEQNRSHLHELFADVLAAYAAGPAYLATCVFVRFNPHAAYREDQTHPAPAARMQAIMETLRLMDEAGGGYDRPYRDIREYVGRAWSDGLAGAGEPQALGESDAERLTRRVEELHGLLRREVPTLAYAGWWNARKLRDSLTNPAGVQPLRDDDTMIDVINAAWLARIEAVDDGGGKDRVNAIGADAFILCQQITARKS